eukprot:TRINITY_DN2776_c0_g1_i1.p1 TRINITY_DN2776_c0_g1~~TRINITY_DN2776_c0_g1_i1.p1  ORF type:complete len:383 (-),score=33.80 TRINITY_DN2776_c0_g1_i1:579-1727(-)
MRNLAMFTLTTIICLWLCVQKRLCGTAIDTLADKAIPQTLRMIYESTNSLKVPQAVFTSPEELGQEQRVMIRWSKRAGQITIRAYQGNYIDSVNLDSTPSRTYANEPFKSESQYKAAFRNLKGSTSFLENQNASFVDERRPVEIFDQFPFSTIGFLQMQECLSGTCVNAAACTATMISATTALTAAHCVYDIEIDSRTGAAFGFYNDYFYYPGRSGSSMPYGVFDIIDIVVDQRWGQGQQDFDYAIIILGPDSEDNPAGSKTGWLGITVDCFEIENYQLNLAGYPSDLSANGDVMYYTFCDNVFLDACSADARLFEYQCTTAKGMSGAPLWVYKQDEGNAREIRGIHSRGLPNKSLGVFIDVQILEFINKVLEEERQRALGK